METLPRLAWQLDLSWLYFPATSRVPARAAPANGMAQRHIAGLGPAQGKDCPGSYHHASQGRRLGFEARVGPVATGSACRRRHGRGPGRR